VFVTAAASWRTPIHGTAVLLGDGTNADPSLLRLGGVSAQLRIRRARCRQILDGVLRIRIGGDVRIATTGEVVIIAAGAAHFAVNGGDAESRFPIEADRPERRPSVAIGTG
jgi:hypothetical protein